MDAVALRVKDFTSVVDIRAHIEEHYGNVFTKCQPYTGNCILCDKFCRSRGELLSHLHTHGGVKPYKCCFCQHSMTFKHNLKRHMNLHEQDQKKKMKACPLCRYRFSEVGDYCDHMKAHSQMTFNCGLCERVFIFEVSLKEHMKLHIEAKETAGGTVEGSKRKLQRKGFSKKHHACRICKRVFRSKSNLTSHFRNQHKLRVAGNFADCVSNNRNINFQQNGCVFTCVVCKFKTKHKIRIQNHIKLHFENRHLFPCQMCNKTFTRFNYSKRHTLFYCKEGYSNHPAIIKKKERFEYVPQRNKLDGCTTKTQFCMKCGMNFISAPAFMKHTCSQSCVLSNGRLSAGSQNEKKEESNGIAALSQSSLFNGMEASSTNPKSYFCDKCGRIFTYRKSYVKHCRFHPCQNTGDIQEPEIKIEISQPSCSLLISNAEHSLASSVCSNENKRAPLRYSCKVCQLLFPKKCNLVRHLSAHRNFESFMCEKCTRPFRNKELLVKHWKVHHTGESLSFTGNVPEVEERKFFDGISTLNMAEVDSEYLGGRECKFLKTEDTIKNEETLMPEKQELNLDLNCILCNVNFGMSDDLIRHVESGSCGLNIRAIQETRLESFNAGDKVEMLKKSHSMRGRPPNKQILRKYVCNVCKKEFTFKNSLERHNLLVHKVRPYKYYELRRRFIGRHFHAIRSKNHPRAMLFPCNICGRQFKTKTMLNKHSKIHSQEHKSKSNRSDENHKKDYTNRQQEGPTYSSVASLIPGKDDKVRSDDTVHIGEKIPPVIRVGENTANKSFGKGDQKGKANSSDSAMKFHVQEMQEKSVCSICKETYESESDMWSHYFSLHVKQKQRYKCPFCRRHFHLKLGVVNHIRFHIAARKSYGCSKKGDPHAAATGLIDSKEHVETNKQVDNFEGYLSPRHASQENQTVEISLPKNLSEDFATGSCNLAWGELIRHATESPERLFTPDNVTRTISGLNEGSSNAVECNSNDHSVSSNTSHKKQAALQREIATEKSSIASLQSCDETNKKRESYESFVSRVNTNFKCNTCKKTFRKNSHLALHIRMAHDKKTYSCHMCEREFGSRSALGKHASGKQCAGKRSSKSKISHLNVYIGKNIVSDAWKEIEKYQNPSQSVVSTCIAENYEEFLKPSHASEVNQCGKNSSPINSSGDIPATSNNVAQEGEIHQAAEMPEQSFALDNVASNSSNELNEGSFSSDDDTEEYYTSVNSVPLNVMPNKEAASMANLVSCNQTKKKQEAYTAYKKKNCSVDQPSPGNPVLVNHRPVACLVCCERFVNIEVYWKHYPCLGISKESDVANERNPFNETVHHEIAIEPVSSHTSQKKGSIPHSEIATEKRSSESLLSCDEPSKKKESMESSIINVDESLMCSICKKTFKKNSQLVRHISLAHGNKTYSCKICGREFRSKISLGRHASSKQCTAKSSSKSKISHSKGLQRNSKLQNLKCHREINNEEIVSDDGKENEKYQNVSQSVASTCMAVNHEEFLNPSHASEVNQSVKNSATNNSSDDIQTRSSNLAQGEQIHEAAEMPEQSFALDNVSNSSNELNEGSFSSDDVTEEYDINDHSVSSNVLQNKGAASSGNSVACDQAKKMREEYTVDKENCCSLDETSAGNPPSVNCKQISCLVCNEKFVNIEVYLKHYPCLGISKESDVGNERNPFNETVHHEIAIEPVLSNTTQKKGSIPHSEIAIKKSSSESLLSCDEPRKKKKSHEGFTSHADQSLMCSVCKKTFEKNSQLVRHISLAHGNKTYSCKICGREFRSKISLGRHASSKQCTAKSSSKSKISHSKGLQRNSKLQNLTSHSGIDNEENIVSDDGKENEKYQSVSQSVASTCMAVNHEEFLNPSHASEVNQSVKNSATNNSSDDIQTRSSNLAQGEQIHEAAEMPEQAFALDNVSNSSNELNEGSFSTDDDSEENYINDHSVSSNVFKNKGAASTGNSVACDQAKKKQEAYTVDKENCCSLDEPSAGNPPVNRRQISCLVCNEKFDNIDVYLKHYPCLGIGKESNIGDERKTFNETLKHEIDIKPEHECYENAGFVDVSSLSSKNCAKETVEQEKLDSVFHCICCSLCLRNNSCKLTDESIQISHDADSMTLSTQGCNTTVTLYYADNSMSEIQPASNSMTVYNRLSAETSTPVGAHFTTVNGSTPDIVCSAFNAHDSVSESTDLNSDISESKGHPYYDGSDIESSLLPSGNDFSTISAAMVDKSNSLSTIVDTVGDVMEFSAISSLSIRDCETLNANGSALVNEDISCRGNMPNTVTSPYSSNLSSSEESSLFGKRPNCTKRYNQETVRDTVTIVAQNSGLRVSRETSDEAVTVKFSHPLNNRAAKNKALFGNESAVPNLCEFLIVDDWMTS